MGERIKVLSLVGLGSIIVIIMLIFYWRGDKSTSIKAPVVSKVKVESLDTPKQGLSQNLTKKSEIKPIVSDDSVIIVNNVPKGETRVDTPKASNDPKDSKDKPVVKAANTNDLNSMWSYLIDNKINKEDRADQLKSFLELLEKTLEIGAIPSLVAKNQFLFSSYSDSGFLSSIYAFPNGTVEILTLVLPPVIDNSKRTITYSILNLGGDAKLTRFDGFDLVPKEKALFTENNSSYILMAGSKLDKYFFQPGETTQVVVLKVDAKGLITVPFDGTNINSLDAPKELVENNVLSLPPSSPNLTPFVYTEVIKEGTLPNKINLVLSKLVGDKKLYDIIVRNGRVVISFVSETK